MMAMATTRRSTNVEAFSSAGLASPGRLAQKRKRRMKNMRMEAPPPSLAMATARPSSFFWRGVDSMSVRTDIMILPKLLLTPTEVQRNVPMPIY
jgi:hypothetical protein